MGWPLSTKTEAKGLAAFADCSKAVKAGMFPGFWCQTVVEARKLIGPVLEHRSGWSFRCGIFKFFWPGASDLLFLDVHFAILVGPLAALTLLCVLLKSIMRSGGQNRVQAEVHRQDKAKVKAE
eukprot:TRINITY_DN25072_c0_g1_i1.p1 TRINITY_DN25072_c0_g1~~TRINITY_DN25072_c0_g1_i1.p1  ORF type:complete len:123 (-),score=21.96 TRINITY_DN25072_c0_g1_i1:90-458(-)